MDTTMNTINNKHAREGSAGGPGAAAVSNLDAPERKESLRAPVRNVAAWDAPETDARSGDPPEPELALAPVEVVALLRVALEAARAASRLRVAPHVLEALLRELLTAFFSQQFSQSDRATRQRSALLAGAPGHHPHAGC
eukprot:SAG31_NODE_12509_length_936_cov_1.407407_1_plen_139_part_00